MRREGAAFPARASWAPGAALWPLQDEVAPTFQVAELLGASREEFSCSASHLAGNAGKEEN